MDKAKGSSRLTGVRAALAKIVQLHHDFPAVLRELGDIERTQSKEETILNDREEIENARKKQCIDRDPDKFISKDYCGMTESLVIEQLEKEATSLNVEVSVAATSLVKAQVKNVIGTSKDDSNYNRDLKGLCQLVKILTQRSLIQGSSLGEQLLQELAFIRLPLRVLWWFHQAKITSFELILRSIYESGHTASLVAEELFCMIKYDQQNSDRENFPKTLNDHNDDDEVSKCLQDLIGVVVALAYDLEEREEYVGLRKYAGNILTSITCEVMDFILEEEKNFVMKRKTGPESSLMSGKREHGNESGESGSTYPAILNWYSLILENSSISNSTLEKYLSSQLVQILTHRPELGARLDQVLREQDRWRSTMANGSLSALLRKLVVGLGHISALNTLELVVTNYEVNWGAVLTLVATTLNSHQDTANTLKHMIEQHIQCGCRDKEIDSLVIGFLFARHACQEGRHIFPPYAQWFLSLFATESTSPANTKPTFVFLMRFLTDFVPHEPAYCLRAHLSNQIFIPRGCQDIKRDYCHLARSRLRDLSETFEPNSRFSQDSSERNKVVQEVDNAISSFGETGKVSKKVIEASIFRKPYFHSLFLPVLLTPRTLPDVPDNKLKIIESLHASGKIPAAMYKNYFLLCRKEASELLSGVFIDVQEEIVIDEPINELEAIINELVKFGERKSEMNEILPILSRVSSKLEELLKFMDARVKDSTFLTIDICLYNEKGIPYLICEKFFHLVELVCCKKFELCIKKELKSKFCSDMNRPSWLGQFLGLLASSITLQAAFFTLLMYNLKQGQGGKLTTEKINLYALILCELLSIDGLFLPVVSSVSPDSIPQNFLNFFIKYLHCNSYKAIEFTTILTSSWVSWYMITNENIFKCEENKAESLDGVLTNIINLYVCLAPRFAVMETLNDKSETKAEYHQSNESLDEKEIFMIDAMDVPEMSLADVYSRLSGYNVPPPSQLYYTDQFKKLQQNDQVSLTDWIKFELQATWAKSQLSVRQTYLQCFIKQEFLEKYSNIQSYNKKAKKSNSKSRNEYLVTTIKDIISVLIDGGMNKTGAGEVVMLLQSLLLQSIDVGVYLMEEWNRISTPMEIPIDSSSDSKRKHRSLDVLLLSFMSLCRCLPSSLFLNADKIIESVGALKSLVENLRSANTSSFMNLTDISYFCNVLFAIASNGNTKSAQLQHYLLPFKDDICFHWDSLQKMFAWEAPEIAKQKCIEDLVSSLSSNNYKSLEATCVSARSVSLILSGSELTMSEACSGPVLLSTMLLYIAQQQIKGRMPMFPPDEQTQLSGEDNRIVSLCSGEMMKQLKSAINISVILREVLPTKNEIKLVNKTVPCAAAFIILCLQKSNHLKDSNKTEAHARMLEILLVCHELMSCWFEQSSVGQATETDGQFEPQALTNKKKSRLSHSPSKLSRLPSSFSNVSSIHSLSYIVQLTQHIYSVISKMPLNAFPELDKNVLKNADSEFKASIQRRGSL